MDEQDEWQNPLAICERCGRKFLSLPIKKPYVDGYEYKGERCGGTLLLTERGLALVREVKSVIDGRCACGHSWEDHEKPDSDIAWDTCSFPCEKCSCFEYEEDSSNAP